MKQMMIAELLRRIAEQSGVPEAQVRAVLQAQTDVTYEHARTGVAVPVPGLGIVQLSERPSRDMIMQFGPDKGKTTRIPASKKLNLLFGKAAKDAILSKIRPPTVDVLIIDPYADSDDGDDKGG